MSAAVAQHFPWCDQGECYVFDDHSRHVSRASHVAIDPAVALPVRGESNGEEIAVRLAKHNGMALVEVDLGDTRGPSTSGSMGVSWLTPAETRAFAALLLETASAASLLIARAASHDG